MLIAEELAGIQKCIAHSHCKVHDQKLVVHEHFFNILYFMPGFFKVF